MHDMIWLVLCVLSWRVRQLEGSWLTDPTVVWCILLQHLEPMQTQHCHAKYFCSHPEQYRETNNTFVPGNQGPMALHLHSCFGKIQREMTWERKESENTVSDIDRITSRIGTLSYNLLMQPVWLFRFVFESSVSVALTKCTITLWFRQSFVEKTSSYSYWLVTFREV